LQVNSDSNIRDASVQMIVGKLTLNSVKWNLTPYNASPPPPAAPPPPPPLPPPPIGNNGFVYNDSFEFPAIGDNSWRLKSAGGLMAPDSGWASTRDIEFHRTATWSKGGGNGTHGFQYAEIEKDISQSFTLPAGGTYDVSFDYRFGDNGSATDNKIEVHWGNVLLATLSPTDGAAWAKHTFRVEGTGAPVTFSLRQVGGANNSHGAFIDLVQIAAAPPLPPSAPVAGSSGLVANGSFENVVLPDGALWEGLTAPAGVDAGKQLLPGWNSTRFFEMWRNVTWWRGYGTDGAQYAELVTDLSQSINLPTGSVYELEVDFRNGNDGTPEGNSVEILWDGELLGKYYPPVGQQWKRVAIPIAGTGQGTLTLRQPLTHRDTDGVHLDRVRIHSKYALVAPPPGCPGGPDLTPVAGRPLRLVD
jgi:hypothetical protein